MHTSPYDSVFTPPEEGTSMKICASLLVLCCVLSGRAHGAELTLDDLFPTDHVLDIQITLPEEDWETIRNFKTTNIFVKMIKMDQKYFYILFLRIIQDPTFESQS